jgi:glycosyltransferase involved in cell wall biosynthesis
MAKNKTTLVILTRNEITGMKALFAKIPFHRVDETIVVDYQSVDGTKEFIQRHKIKLINQTKPGRGEAFRLAVSHARGNFLVFFSPDGNEDPTDIPQLIQGLSQGYDLVIASRFMAGARNEEDDQWLKFRAWANQAFTWLANICFHGRLSDSINGYRAITKDAFSRLQLDADGYAIEWQMSMRALKLKFKIKEFPTREGNRLGGFSGSKALPSGWLFLKVFLKELFDQKI